MKFAVLATLMASAASKHQKQEGKLDDFWLSAALS